MPSLRRGIADLLKPTFLRGAIHSLVPDFLGELALKVAYASKLSAWFKSHPLEPNFDKRFDLFQHVLTSEGLDEPIDYVEFGVAGGDSIRWWAEHVRHPEARFFGFDTFEGLPERWGGVERGTFSQQGQLPDLVDERVSFEVGLFQETLPDFARRHKWGKRLVLHLDADLFSSTLFVLGNLANVLKPGDVLLFDEFTRIHDATHEFRAFYDFCAAYGMRFSVLGASGGYVQVAMRVDGAIGSVKPT